MENWLASALPVADAVSFKSDDINVTAQRVMTQTATLMAACSPADACIINYEVPD